MLKYLNEHKMMRRFLLCLQLMWILVGSNAQRSSYSLQTAVDELHQRNAPKYPLNDPPTQHHYFGSAVPDQDYWDEDSDLPANTNNQNSNHHRLNKALAKFLEHKNYESDRGGLNLEPPSSFEFDDNSNSIYNGLTDETKRSSYFRELDDSFDKNLATVIRERDPLIPNESKHAESTEEFLREIEETQNRDRKERYKEALRNLWEKYQQQENQIESDLFEEKKRMRTPPYYMLMQKKSSYPVLPWLPYSSERKKRFPVAKRSTKRFSNENLKLGKTDEKVTKELSELFGTANDDKKKRSTGDQIQVFSTHSPGVALTLSSDMHLEKPVQIKNSSETATTISAGDLNHNPHNHSAHHEHTQKDHSVPHESQEEESEEADDGEEVDDEHEDFEDDGDAKKKKRDTVGSKGLKAKLIASNQLLPQDLTSLRKKKSIQWSKYFGIDRKKKPFKKNTLDVQKRSTDLEDNHYDGDNIMETHELDPEKLDLMDKKLQSIEEFLIDETIKYTGAHEGTTSPEEIRVLKDHVSSRLATAYNLEKMRRALEILRQTMDAENHLLRNVIEPEPENLDKLENFKRLSVKKENNNLRVLPTFNEHLKDLKPNKLSTLTGSHAQSTYINDDSEKGIKTQKKKRNGYLRYPDIPNGFTDIDEGNAGRYETLNDAYLGNKNYIIGSYQCPLLESIAERCRGVDLLSGDINQELLPLCGAHQICYLCGSSQIACDYQYLTKADSVCENNDDCQAIARSVLLVLRGSPGPQLGQRRCQKNTCLYSAMRELNL